MGRPRIHVLVLMFCTLLMGIMGAPPCPRMEANIVNSLYDVTYASEDKATRRYCFRAGGRQAATCSPDGSSCCPTASPPPAIAALTMTIQTTCLAKAKLAIFRRFRWSVGGVAIKPAVNIKAGTLLFTFSGKRKLPASGTVELCLDTGGLEHDCHSPRALCGAAGCQVQARSAPFKEGRKRVQCCVAATLALGCSVGHGGPSCELCGPGSFSNATEADPRGPCAPCEAGSTSPAPGATSCPACLPGHGGDSCGACPANSFAEGNKPGRPACNLCAPNSVAPQEGSSSCTRCPSGQVRGNSTGACEPVAVLPNIHHVLPATVTAIGFAFSELAVALAEGAAPATTAVLPPTLKFAWDGGMTVAFQLTRDGAQADDPGLLAMKEMFVDVCTTFVPVVEYVPYPLPASKTAVIDIAATLDGATGLTTISSSGGNVGHFMGLVLDQLEVLYNMTLPALTSPEGAAGALVRAATVTLNSTEVTSVSVDLEYSGAAPTGTAPAAGGGVPSSLTSINDLAAYLGIDFSIPDGIVAIADPQLFYMVKPVQLVVNFVISIPALRLDWVPGTLRVNTDKSAFIEVNGNFKPVDTVEFYGIRLTPVRGQDNTTTGLSGQSIAYFGGVPLIASATIGVGSKLEFILTQSGVDAAPLVCAMYSKARGCPSADPFVTAPVMALLNAVDFTEAAVTYDSGAVAPKRLALSGAPVLAQVPGLFEILSFVHGIAGDDLGLYNSVMVKATSDEFSFGISKAFNVSLGSPFTKPGVAAMSIQVASGALGVGVKAELSFATALRLPGIKDPTGLDVRAAVTVSPEAGVAFGLAARTTTAIVFSAPFSFIKVNALEVAAAFGVTPFILNYLRLFGDIQIFGVSGQALILWDRAAADFALMGNVTNLSLQHLIGEWGIDLDLGSFDLNLRQVMMSFATLDIPALGVQKGMQLKAGVGFLGMDCRAELRLDTSGYLKVAVAIDVSELNRILQELLKDAVKLGLGAVKAGMEVIRAGFEAADEALAVAEQAYEGALDALDYANRQLMDLVSPLLDEVEAIGNQLAIATLNLDVYVFEVHHELDKAVDKFYKARGALEDARAWADKAVKYAIDKVLSTKQAFEAARDAVLWPLNAAIDVYNWVVGKYNSAIHGCTHFRLAHFWEVFSCPAAIALWPAVQTANAAVNLARQAFNAATNGATWALYKAAEAALETTRFWANLGIRAAQVALDASYGAWQVANAVVEAIEDSPLYKIRKDLLRAQQQAASNLHIAQTTSDIAKAATDALVEVGKKASALDAARAAVQAAAEGIAALEDALDEVGKLLGDLVDGLFVLRLDALAANLELSSKVDRVFEEAIITKFKLGLSFDLVVLSEHYRLHDDFCLTFYTDLHPSAAAAGGKARPSLRWRQLDFKSMGLAQPRAAAAIAAGGRAAGGGAAAAGVGVSATGHVVKLDPLDVVLSILKSKVGQVIGSVFPGLRRYINWGAGGSCYES